MVVVGAGRRVGGPPPEPPNAECLVLAHVVAEEPLQPGLAEHPIIGAARHAAAAPVVPLEQGGYQHQPLGGGWGPLAGLGGTHALSALVCPLG